MNNHRLITAMVIGKIPFSLLEQLKEEQGIITANKTHARGTSSNANYEMHEMEVLTLTVEGHRAEEVFNYLFELLEMDQPGRGMLLQERLARCTPYALPLLENA